VLQRYRSLLKSGLGELALVYLEINLSHSGHKPNINTLSIACDNVNPIVGPATTTQLMKKSQKEVFGFDKKDGEKNTKFNIIKT